MYLIAKRTTLKIRHVNVSKSRELCQKYSIPNMTHIGSGELFLCIDTCFFLLLLLFCGRAERHSDYWITGVLLFYTREQNHQLKLIFHDISTLLLRVGKGNLTLTLLFVCVQAQKYAYFTLLSTIRILLY